MISSDIIAEEGQDVAPAYLPDGRILFSSTRQRQSKAILLDENKPQFEATNEARNESAFVLHVMNADGTDIHQISFNPSSDLYATVLQNGRVLFTRWDHAPGRDGLHLYTSNPGRHRHAALLRRAVAQHRHRRSDRAVDHADRVHARARDERRPPHGADARAHRRRLRRQPDHHRHQTYVENNQPLAASAGIAGPAQTPATLNDVRTVPGPSPGGRFESGFPLWDGTNRILVSWSQCRLLDVGGADPTRIVPCTRHALADPNVQIAPPLYSIWMFDPVAEHHPAGDGAGRRRHGHRGRRGAAAHSAAGGDPRQEAAGRSRIPTCVSEGVGILSIRSVYDIMGVDQARTRQQRCHLDRSAVESGECARTRSAWCASSASRSRSRFPTMTTSPIPTTPRSAPPA